MDEYYVYRFKNADDCIIYVGKTKNLRQRLKYHEHITDNVKTIEYIKCISEAEMTWKEIYYINLFYNELSTNISNVYPDRDLTPIKLNDIWIKYNSDYCGVNQYISIEEYNSFMNNIPKHNYKELIHILNHYKLNSIGEDKYSLTERWFTTNKDKTSQLKNNVLNFFY